MGQIKNIKLHIVTDIKIKSIKQHTVRDIKPIHIIVDIFHF